MTTIAEPLAAPLARAPQIRHASALRTLIARRLKRASFGSSQRPNVALPLRAGPVRNIRPPA